VSASRPRRPPWRRWHRWSAPPGSASTERANPTGSRATTSPSARALSAPAQRWRP
jgi:hypothetical protein